MTPEPDRSSEDRKQKAVARKYRALGYSVDERPAPERLPDFLQGAAPDIVARSEADNVIIEIRTRASLKGSNDLVTLAERVSGRPDWRFELVVLGNGDGQQASSEAAFDHMLERVKAVSSLKLFDVAYVYLAAVLVTAAQEAARRHGMKPGRKTDRSLLDELGFKGILPAEVVEASLAALATRDAIVHAVEAEGSVSEDDVAALTRLCERLREAA